MDTEISYAGILRRVLASVIDCILWITIAFVSAFCLTLSSIPHNGDVSDIYITSTHMIIFMTTLLITYIVFNILMITKYGGTPGRLLCSIRIKDANTFTNVTLMQATIRYIFREGIWLTYNLLSDPLPGYVSGCLLIVLISALMFAIFDQRKQTFYDKIAKTVVIDYKPS
ncbi:MAG: RDD family protein [Rickettsiales bacterium]|jgi:uncharacterized RDD family membrane protein YckC|nr:RDD family protein [Rickettsiales bacterium]